jgi:sporulation protein YlmC with PRC-barrel domain
MRVSDESIRGRIIHGYPVGAHSPYRLGCLHQPSQCARNVGTRHRRPVGPPVVSCPARPYKWPDPRSSRNVCLEAEQSVGKLGKARAPTGSGCGHQPDNHCIIIAADGQAVGEINAIFLDCNTWRVESLRVTPRKDIADELGAHRSAFHAGALEIPVGMVTPATPAGGADSLPAICPQ